MGRDVRGSACVVSLANSWFRIWTRLRGARVSRVPRKSSNSSHPEHRACLLSSALRWALPGFWYSQPSLASPEQECPTNRVGTSRSCASTQSMYDNRNWTVFAGLLAFAALANSCNLLESWELIRRSASTSSGIATQHETDVSSTLSP